MLLTLQQDGDTVTGFWLIPATDSGLAKSGPLSERVITVPSQTRFGQFKSELTNVDSD
jgi:hypothetical protein